MTDRDKRRREGPHRYAVGVNDVKTHRIFEDVSTRDNPHFFMRLYAVSPVSTVVFSCGI